MSVSIGFPLGSLCVYKSLQRFGRFECHFCWVISHPTEKHQLSILCMVVSVELCISILFFLQLAHTRAFPQDQKLIFRFACIKQQHDDIMHKVNTKKKSNERKRSKSVSAYFDENAEGHETDAWLRTLFWAGIWKNCYFVARTKVMEKKNDAKYRWVSVE